MTLICSKCGSGNIFNDMEYGSHEEYKKCLMCGSIAVKEEKIMEGNDMAKQPQITPSAEVIKRLEAIRAELGIFSVEFTKYIGISRSQWDRIRNPKHMGKDIFERIANNLGVSYDWLMEGTGEKKSFKYIEAPVHDAGYPLPEAENNDGGKILDEAKTVDSQQSTEDKNKVVGNNSNQKAIKVLELYEYADNGRKATIGIKDGKYSQVRLDGVKQFNWEFDDIKFLHGVTGEILRMAKA